MCHQIVMNQVLLERLHEGGATGLQAHAIIGTGIIHQSVDVPITCQDLADSRRTAGFIAEFSQEKTGLWLMLLQAVHQLVGRFGIADDHRNSPSSASVIEMAAPIPEPPPVT